jgi:anti-sigma-K factor RskA
MDRNARIEDELFPFYALDALTDEERSEVESYVAGNPAAAARLAALADDASLLAEASGPLAPAPEVKARLMARVEADLAEPSPNPLPREGETAATRPSPPASPAPLPPRSPASPRFNLRDFFFGRALGFAVLLLLLGGVGLWMLAQQSSGLRTRVADLEAQLATLQSENQVLRDELAAREEILAQFLRPGAVTLALGDATGEHPTAYGTVTLSPDGAALLAVANLPPPAADQTYQAWLIVGDTPISAGTFAVDAAGQGHHFILDVAPGAFDAVGVSLEPAGGSDSPTPGNIVLVGNLNS